MTSFSKGFSYFAPICICLSISIINPSSQNQRILTSQNMDVRMCFGGGGACVGGWVGMHVCVHAKIFWVVKLLQVPTPLSQHLKLIKFRDHHSSQNEWVGTSKANLALSKLNSSPSGHRGETRHSGWPLSCRGFFFLFFLSGWGVGFVFQYGMLVCFPPFFQSKL